MKQFFKDLYEYNHHCNQKSGDAINCYPDLIPEKAMVLFNHVLNAHQIWNNRVFPRDTPFGVWEIHPTQELLNIDKNNWGETIQIIENFDFNMEIEYTNSKAQVFQNRMLDVLFHVINHSTYHRGQIATEFKRVGLNPLISDFIFFKR